MDITRTNTTDNNIELLMTIPWDDIKKAHESVMDEWAKEVEVPGFRKGMAPKNMVEGKLDPTKVYEEVIKRLIPEVYGHAVEQEKMQPIVYPKIELVEAKENENWKIKATTCEKPAVDLGDYKKAVADVKAAKQNKIWTPGDPEEKKEEKDTKPTIDELLRGLLTTVKVTIPSILIEQEVNRLLSELMDQTKKLGLSVDQYLASTKKTRESIRGEYETQATQMLSLEFAMEQIAEEEKIMVTPEEIETIINGSKTPEEKHALEQEKPYLSHVLRRQKTLDYLAAI